MSNLWRTRDSLPSAEHGQNYLETPTEQIFLPAIRSGLDQFLEISSSSRSPLRNRTKANLLNDYITHDAIANYHDAQYPEAALSLNEDCDGCMFLVDQVFSLRIKKLDTNYKPRNYPTNRQVDIKWQQLELPGVPMPTYVTLGYRLDPSWTSIRDVKIICDFGVYNHWTIPVCGEVGVPLLDAQMSADDIPAPRPRVRSQISRENEGTA